MTLKNVQKIETQEIHEKSWFHRFRNKVLVGSSALVVGSSAMAEAVPPPDFLAGANTSLTTIAAGLGALFLLAIGITLLIISFSNSRGGIRKAG